jgi:hypothetical protein
LQAGHAAQAPNAASFTQEEMSTVMEERTPRGKPSSA